MSVYNAEEYLQESIDSILSQTFSDFEFIIIEDCSTDNSKRILQGITDKRVKLIFNKMNIGLTRSLNKGLANVAGKYIARMDADDISRTKRLRKQFEFMEINPNIGVCGSKVEIIDSEKVWVPGEFHNQILVNMLFHNDIYHPSVMVRSDLIKKYNYNEDLRTAQDYYLWAKLAPDTEFHNIQEVLLERRIHDDSIGNIHTERQKNDADKARDEFFKFIGMDFDRENFEKRNKSWFKRIKKNNLLYKFYNQKLLRQKLNFYCPSIFSKIKKRIANINL